MKVLLQEWSSDQGGQTSISKDQAQLEETIEGLKGKAEPEGDSYEVEIPDDHAFAEMIDSSTIFLIQDEMDVITYIDE